MTSEEVRRIVEAVLVEKQVFDLWSLLLLILIGSLALYFRSYLKRKGENLATKEDVKEITRKVEVVKTEFDVFRHTSREVFNKEYKILERVWELAWELQACSRSLKPILDSRPADKTQDEIDQERWSRYIDAKKAFIDGVIKSRPFIPGPVYEVAMEIRSAAIEDEVRFEVFRKDMPVKQWEDTLENAKRLDELVDCLNDKIREYVEQSCGRS